MEYRKLKIAFLSFFSGLNDRGVETLVYEVGNRLSRKNEVFVFQSGEKPREAKYNVVRIPTNWKVSDIDNRLTLKRRFFLDKTSQAVKGFTKKCLPVLKKEKFDVVIPWNNGLQALLIKINRVGKWIAVGQSGLGWDDRIVLYLFPDKFIGFTDYQCSWAKKVNPFVEVVKIPNGVDRRFFENKEKLDIKLPRPIILTVAAYSKIKRLDLAIKAVSKLDESSLVLVGKGELEDDLKRFANKMLPGRHAFLEIPYDEIQRAYKAADLLTFPSKSWESFGIAILEAMASGLPVVANSDPIRSEIVGNAGILVDPTDTDEYARALKNALNTDWGNKPQEQAKKFDWDKIAKEYEELFRELTK